MEIPCKMDGEHDSFPREMINKHRPNDKNESDDDGDSDGDSDSGSHASGSHASSSISSAVAAEGELIELFIDEDHIVVEDKDPSSSKFTDDATSGENARRVEMMMSSSIFESDKDLSSSKSIDDGTSGENARHEEMMMSSSIIEDNDPSSGENARRMEMMMSSPSTASGMDRESDIDGDIDNCGIDDGDDEGEVMKLLVDKNIDEPSSATFAGRPDDKKSSFTGTACRDSDIGGASVDDNSIIIINEAEQKASVTSQDVARPTTKTSSSFGDGTRQDIMPSDLYKHDKDILTSSGGTMNVDGMMVEPSRSSRVSFALSNPSLLPEVNRDVNLLKKVPRRQSVPFGGHHNHHPLRTRTPSSPAMLARRMWHGQPHDESIEFSNGSMDAGKTGRNDEVKERDQPDIIPDVAETVSLLQQDESGQQQRRSRTFTFDDLHRSIQDMMSEIADISDRRPSSAADEVVSEMEDSPSKIPVNIIIHIDILIVKKLEIWQEDDPPNSENKIERRVV